MIDNQFIIDNHDTNLNTPTQMVIPENGNQIEGKGEFSSPSSNLHRKQLKEQPITAPCISKRKTSETNKKKYLITSDPTTDLTGLMNKEHHRGGKDNNNRITNALIAKTAVAIPSTLTKSNMMEDGDDP